MIGKVMQAAKVCNRLRRVFYGHMAFACSTLEVTLVREALHYDDPRWEVIQRDITAWKYEADIDRAGKHIGSRAVKHIRYYALGPLTSDWEREQATNALESPTGKSLGIFQSATHVLDIIMGDRREDDEPDEHMDEATYGNMIADRAKRALLALTQKGV